MGNIIEYELLDMLEKTRNWRYLRDYLRKLADNKESINVKEYLLKKVNSKTILERLAYNYKKIGYMYSIDVLREIIINDEELLKKSLNIGFTEVLEKSNIDELKVDNISLIEYLFQNNLVTKKNLDILLPCKNIFYYVKKYKQENLLKNIKLEELLLKEKNHKLYLDEFIESKIYWEFHKMDINLIEEIINRKQYDLLINLEEHYLLQKINNETILELLLKNNITPKLEYYKCKESFMVISKYKKYELLIDSNMGDLVIKNQENKFIIEEFLLSGNTPNDREFIDPNVVYYIIKTKRTELYSKLNLKTLITNGDLNNKFLDIILEEAKQDKTIKLPKVKVRNNRFLKYEEIARIYICYAKHDMQHKLDLSSSILFHENKLKHKVFLEYLLEEDEQITKEKLINKVLIFDEIQAVLKLHEYKNQFPNIKKVEENIVSNQLKKYKIDNKDEEINDLIDELINLFKDEYQDEKVIELLRINYTYLCNKDSSYINEVKRLIELKKENPFIQLSLTKDGSHYVKGRVLIEDEIMYILNHEMGHLFYEYLCNRKIPYEFDKVVMSLRCSKDFMEEKLVYFTGLANDLLECVEVITDDILDKLYKGKEEEYKKEIEEYLSTANIPDWIESRLNRKVLTEEYMEEDRKIKKRTLKYLLMRNKFPKICIISDILDAITYGEYGSFCLKDKDGKKLNCLFGHGAAYYRNDKHLIFNEMLANYSSLIKLNDSEEAIILLKQLVGDEFVTMLDKYYNEYILSDTNEMKRKNRD